MTRGPLTTLGLWLALAAASPCACGSASQGGERSEPPAGEEASLELLDGGTAKAVGRVVANEQHCTVDAQCWLVVDLGERTIKVIYVEAEAIPTINDAAADAGFAAQPGDLVEVYGATEGTGSSLVLSTCGDEDFYIRKTTSSR